ncbi:hypothetical protein A2617_03455 [Candidatus Daviesbacteria bacterium RIFOXYD1_FULL_41_10]|uniref:Uncharacterized protein n=2 Tax=Candidatus Daviesiibacteriota TaxID=1752718 RepID=A0A1F5MYW8_9BACT|nr:MAG: hypothetical protein UU67_C0025G0009 [Candidatus Daviesbacteria bacterium GW2011_GWB1_41_5]OGE70579.1 MAG: hypothetical protein A2617_03455 [Candidatus Daviesbacteria bacterium RIFOXYD1_FULL_41_10]
MKFQTKHPQYEYLRKKWVGRQKAVSEKFLATHGETIRRATLGGLGGLMLMTTSGAGFTENHNALAGENNITYAEDKNRLLAESLKDIVPEEVRKLTTDEETQIAEVLSGKMGFKVAGELEGIRLNRSYGLIGGEQHLYRFPGDNLYKHADNAADWAMYGPAGIAPGLGAWGYFAPSESSFSEEDKMREKYYLAVQTFLAPGFAENVGKFRDFFRFRKMLVVNPKTGQAVVAVVGDAGPAEWTGKHLGGSPEAMHYLGLAKGPRKGAVLYFFVDDPKNEVPLGPIQMNGSTKI